MNKQETIKDLIDKIARAKNAGQFKNYIEYIRFPFYKNLSENTKITFDFPFTVFTGQNGSGKSSALHALQGAPDGESPRKFWYSTSMDPILDDNKNRNCFIYGYYNADRSSILEVLKTRVQAKNDPDYWEPSRPLKKYNMKTMAGSRNPAIKKVVFYSDFRAELSAYDKYMYFSELRRTKTISSKQDYVRKYSSKIKKALDTNSVQTYGIKDMNDLPIILSNDELAIISKILGKTYVECKILKHKWFRTEGYTIFFKTDSLEYSEAFAGRGEYAVVKVVHEIHNSPKYSLIVLDEPEVSLHPGAQEQLKIYLLSEVLKKKLQIIISSHSISFIQDLPYDSVKLFYPTSTGKFIVKNDTHKVEAFNFIGHDPGIKSTIQVEDKLAQKLLQKVLESLDSGYHFLFEVVYYPGGSSELYKRATRYSMEEDRNKFLLLDGDERKPKINPSRLNATELKSFENLDLHLKSSTNMDFNSLGFPIDSSQNVGQKIQFALKFLDFIWDRIEYLPGDGNPEKLLWNTELAKEYLKIGGKQIPVFTDDYKSNFAEFSKSFLGEDNGETISAVHNIFIEDFIKRKDENYQEIGSIIERLKHLTST